jgi:hypothetical protein
MLIPALTQLSVANAPSIRNSPCARLITRIIPKMTASPIETMTSSDALSATEMTMFAT